MLASEAPPWVVLVVVRKEPRPGISRLCRVLGPSGLDRRVHEARSVALRYILIDRGAFRVGARYPGRGVTPVGDLPRRQGAWALQLFRRHWEQSSTRTLWIRGEMRLEEVA